MLLASRSKLVILPEKNRGTNTNRFFTHCSTRSSFKYFFIYVVSNAKIVNSKFSKDKNTKKTAGAVFYENIYMLNYLLPLFGIVNHFLICSNCEFNSSVFSSSFISIITCNRHIFTFTFCKHS